MRFVFFGDGLWAAKCLRRLLDEGHQAQAVVQRLKPSDSALADLAQEKHINLCSPQKVNQPDFVDWVSKLQPDLNISMSYDQILRQPIIDCAPQGFINCHAGKLPFYRGRNVINWAIINNEQEIGLTIHYIDQGIDTGDIILQRTLPITWSDTYGTVLAKVQDAFPGLLAEAVTAIENGQVDRRPQDPSEGTYFSARVPGDEWIDWNESSLNIYNKVRAITLPGPGTRTLLGHRTMIIWSAKYDPEWPKYIATPGEVVGVVPGQGVKVKTGDSTLILEKLQFEDEAEGEPNFRIGTRFGANAGATVQQLQVELSELRKTLEELRGESSESAIPERAVHRG